jgi:hypothetical protein
MATADIPGVLMQTNMDQTVLAEWWLTYSSKLIQTGTQNMPTQDWGGKRVMYMQLRKALYGTVTTSLLFWKDLSLILIINWGFECQ